MKSQLNSENIQQVLNYIGNQHDIFQLIALNQRISSMFDFIECEELPLIVKERLFFKNLPNNSLVIPPNHHSDSRIAVHLFNFEIDYALYQWLLTWRNFHFICPFIVYTQQNCHQYGSNVPEGVTIIDQLCFTGITTPITLPTTVTELMDEAFNDCLVEELVIPDSVLSLGEQCFRDCYNLTKITLPSGITLIPWSCFSGCLHLKSITLPETVEDIESNAFSYCGLTSITLPSKVTTISVNCFAACTSLQSITAIGVTQIESGAMINCGRLISVTVKNIIQLDIAPDCLQQYDNVKKEIVDISNCEIHSYVDTLSNSDSTDYLSINRF